MNSNVEIENLKIDEVIWVIFIFLSIINIIGDECKKEYYVNQDKNKEELSKISFLIILLYFHKFNIHFFKNRTYCFLYLNSFF